MIGIIMLKTKFPRLLGDIGNPDTFKQKPIYVEVDAASVSAVVRKSGVTSHVLDAMIRAAKNLESRGARVIGTSCGFLSLLQQEIQQAVSVPVVSSSLLLIPMIRAVFGKDVQIGVLTFDSAELSESHFLGEYDSNISISGLYPNGELYRTINEDRTVMDKHLAKMDVFDAARRCVDANSNIKFLLLECTNLSPWKNELRSEFGMPVHDLVDVLEFFHTS